MKFLLLVLLLTAGCKTTQHLSSYTIGLITNEEDGEQKCDALYSTMLASAAKDYKTYSEDYRSIENEIDDIVATAAGRKDIYTIAVNLQVKFLQFEKEHAAVFKLDNEQINGYRKAVKELWQTLINAEMTAIK